MIIKYLLSNKKLTETVIKWILILGAINIMAIVIDEKFELGYNLNGLKNEAKRGGINSNNE